MVWEFPAVSQTRKEFWGEPQYTRKGMLLFTAVFGVFGLHHLLLRSPQTAVLFFFTNILTLGYCYWHDVLQLAGMPTKDLNKYGLALPWGPAGIAQGMWKCGKEQGEEQEKEATETSPPNPWWFFLYSLLLPFGPLASLIAGDTGGALAKVMSILFIPLFLIWLLYDNYQLLLKPADVMYNGASRIFPFRAFGWMPDGMSPRLTGESRVKGVDDSQDSLIVRTWKGMVIAFLPFLKRVLPFDLVTGIELAVSTGKAVKETAERVATTGMKVAQGVGKLATEVPAAAGPALATAAQAAANPEALLQKQIGGGEESLSLSDKVVGGGLVAVLIGGFLLTLGRSYNETLFHFNGPSDSPPKRA
jgi:hypothetical protein